MSTALVWFRRDLRLADNPALRAAIDQHDRVVSVYIHAAEEEAPWAAGAASRWWLHHSLAALNASLESIGASLVIRSGESLTELRALIRATQATAVYWNRPYEPALIARDKRIKSALREDGIDVHSHNAALLFEPWQIQTNDGGPYKVFTPFWRKADSRLRRELAQGRAPLPAVHSIHPHDPQAETLPLSALALLPEIDWADGLRQNWTPGERGAHNGLEAFCEDAVARYRQRRDLPAAPATSKLSPHLHFGEISPLQVAARLERQLTKHHDAGLSANAEWYVRELGWREFSHHLLYHFPQTQDQPLYEKFANFPWRKPDDYAEDLKAWQRGRTGIPIVDAGMRELWHTGWMHNRVRMIVASFLTKNLLIPWQEGARWFWDTLVDADLANNTQGWQWSTGCGADAAPYFRIFNPVTQSEKFDGDGAYIKRWVPELTKLSGKSLHAPWQHDTTPKDYPLPIADLGDTRRQALAAYQTIR